MQLDRLDLHGYTVADAMRRFAARYNALASNQPGRGIKVIHGKGTGASAGLIREALREFLRSEGTALSDWDLKMALLGDHAALGKARRLAYTFGEKIKLDIEDNPDVRGNAGCTVVIPLQRVKLPVEWR